MPDVKTTTINDPSTGILDGLLSAGKELGKDFVDLLKFEKQIELNNSSQKTQQQLNGGGAQFKEGNGNPFPAVGGSDNTAIIIAGVAAGALILVLALR